MEKLNELLTNVLDAHITLNDYERARYTLLDIDSGKGVVQASLLIKQYFNNKDVTITDNNILDIITEWTKTTTYRNDNNLNPMQLKEKEYMKSFNVADEVYVRNCETGSGTVIYKAKVYSKFTSCYVDMVIDQFGVHRRLRGDEISKEVEPLVKKAKLQVERNLEYDKKIAEKALTELDNLLNK